MRKNESVNANIKAEQRQLQKNGFVSALLHDPFMNFTVLVTCVSRML